MSASYNETRELPDETRPEKRKITDWFGQQTKSSDARITEETRPTDPESSFLTGSGGENSESRHDSIQDIPLPEGEEGHPTNLNIPPNKPHHPANPSLIIPPKVTKTQNIYFQAAWFSKYPWLHYDPEIKGVLCLPCLTASKKGLPSLAKAKDNAFIVTGFSNWKKVLGTGKGKPGRFEQNTQSETHKFALSQLASQKAQTVKSQIITQSEKQQEINRRMLLKLFTSVRYLLRQGLAIRGHDDDEGNFRQLLSLRRNDDRDFDMYLEMATNFASHQSQEEMMELFSHSILRGLSDNVRHNEIFAIMVDGTQDINGTEQESLCIRHVDNDLNVHEDFVGLYEMNSTTGEAISSMIQDVLIRLRLPIELLRAQTYDGVSNMSGKYNGCQAKIKAKQPLAMFFHCNSHVSNLVMQESTLQGPQIRDAIQWVHELGLLYQRSGKVKAIFQDIATHITDGCDRNSTATIRPLCPTRWFYRQAAIESVITNYEAVISSLEAISQSVSVTPEVASKANGLLGRFQKGVLLGLKAVNLTLALLESLNRGLQARSATISGVETAVKMLLSELQKLRDNDEFHKLCMETSELVSKYNLDPLEIPRRRQPPRRLSGDAPTYQPQSAEEYYRRQYFLLIDTMMSSLRRRFDVSASSGLSEYKKLEEMLTTGCVNEDILNKYPELRRYTPTSMDLQLKMLLSTTGASSVHEAKLAYRSMSQDVRDLFPSVFMLLRLLLVCPVTSCEFERSFSALRRLKTWLRSTMTQRRLNFVAVCNVQKSKLDGIDITSLAQEFISKSEARKNVFGNFI